MYKTHKDEMEPIFGKHLQTSRLHSAGGCWEQYAEERVPPLRKQGFLSWVHGPAGLALCNHFLQPLFTCEKGLLFNLAKMKKEIRLSKNYLTKKNRARRGARLKK
ncbi:MAG TPA: hypothetical protein DER23_06260 [Clostridiales bacterium]|nr:hypothetical protein [Clostridiales bacterium]HCG35933.1 hypothetical protein [Clostridiales bacterium]